MSLRIENERVYQRIEPESVQNIIKKFVRYNNKSMYPEEIITSILDKHIK